MGNQSAACGDWAILTCTTAKPTAPSPNTATEAPASTLHVFHTAPNPVLTPHPNKHALFRGMRLLIFAALISAMTVYSEKVEQPMKWKMGVPSLVVNRDVPPGMCPAPCVLRMVGHKVVFGYAQKMHFALIHI